MNNILLGIIAIFLLAVVVFLVPVLMELRRTVVSLRKTLEYNLNPALDELRLALKGLRNISDNVNDAAADVRRFSKSISDIGETISAVNGLMANVGSSTAVKAISLRAGIRAAVEYFLKNLIKKGDGK